MSRLTPLFLLALCVCFFADSKPSFAADKEVLLLSYYKDPPFVVGDREGLIFDFAELLNRHSEGKYEFTLQFFPRKRLDKFLYFGGQCIVPFVNWNWMYDPDKVKYLWTPPFLVDSNAVVSRREGRAPVRIDYRGPDSLKGVIFGGVLGRRYKGLEESFADGSIFRSDAPNAESVLRMLALGRVDAMTAPASQLRHQVEEMGLVDKLYFSSRSLFSYTRHLLVTKELEEEYVFLVEFLESLSGNPDWRKALEKYGLRSEFPVAGPSGDLP